MNETLRRLVVERAGGRCEYCRLPQAASFIPFEVDHIIAVQHRGKTVRGNLALACFVELRKSLVREGTFSFD